MPTIPSTIRYEQITQILSAIPVADLEATRLFLEGDHWQKQAGWVGWRPEAQSHSAVNDWDIIERGFTPKNVIKGMVSRLQGAILGKEPDWEIVSANAPPPEGDPTKISTPSVDEKAWKAVDETITEWWTDKRVHGALKDFIRNYAAYGKAALHIYIPKGYTETNKDGVTTLRIKNGADLSDVLKKIFVYSPSYGNVINAQDPDFGEEFVVLKLTPPPKWADPNAPDNAVTYELHYLDEDGQTHIRQVSQDNKSVDVSIDLLGNLLTYVAGEYPNALISEPVKRQQRALNHAKTMENYAIANINFPETVFINAAMETERQKGPDGSMVDVVKPLYRGVGRFISLFGLTTYRADGSEAITTPDVKYKTPADPEKFAKVAENNTRDMHQEAGMLYILMSSSPYPSGDARVESMTDYLILLVDYKTLCDTLGVWLLTTVLRLAFTLTGKQDQADKFKVIFSTKLTIGRVSDADKTVMLQEVSAGLRSRRGYMVTAEVTDDPDSELKIIAADPPMQLPTPTNGDNTGEPKPKETGRSATV